MDRFIEVVGVGKLVERVAEYRADVTLQVRAAQVETAIKEVADLRNECIRRLRDAGLNERELQEGGAEVWRPWFWKKKPGQEASQKLLVSSDDMQRLLGALGSLEPLFENQRYSLSVSMRQPLFEAGDGARREAERDAITDAEAKATNVALVSGLTIAGVIEIEELDVKVSRSGAYGDQDWGIAFAAGGGAAAESTEPLEAATRSSSIRFRVRFAAEPGASSHH
ncbi:MAG TPA: SIMPL domain-containing protein [Ideonella sp.]|uniref:SIMPL domain-containing protein n=1 Tax=Ideonella sp. TaxID=1929293 RepID=UPI002E37029E|nr:SIMPL domain-containing protein [Ideonella sp.]HEX5687426.1 SIMPL domain-containing protein [Ideonella sp.]